MKKILSDQRGSYLVIMTAMTLMLALLFVGMVEVGKVLIVKEQTQTATDAAALAASGTGVKKWVEIEVTTKRGSYRSCSTKSDGRTRCSCYDCGTAPPVVVQGTEEVLIKQGGWKTFCDPYCGSCSSSPSCTHKVLDKWITYDIPDSTSINGNSSSVNANMCADKVIEHIARAIFYQRNDSRRTELMQALNGLSLDQLLLFSAHNQKDAFVKWYFDKTGLTQAENKCQSSRCDCVECKDGSCLKENVPAQKGDEGAVCWDLGSLGEVCSKPICYKDWEACRQVKYGIPTAERYHELLCSQRSRIIQMAQMYDNNERLANTPFSGSTAQIAQTFFEANLPASAENAEIVKIHSYQGYDQRNNPFYPSVVVYAKATVQPITDLILSQKSKITNCSQANTFYKDIPGEKWIRSAEDACWVDWEDL